MPGGSRWLRALRFVFFLLILAWGLIRVISGDWVTVRYLVAGLLVGPLLLGITSLSQPFAFKNILLAVYSPPRYNSTSPDKLRGLDTCELERLTREWQNLGFVPVGDFSVSALTPKPNSLSLFARFLEHESGAIAELLQNPSSNSLPFISHLQSFWGESEREPLLRQARQRLSDVLSPAPLANPTSSAEKELANPVPDLKIWALTTHNMGQKTTRSRYAEFVSHARFLGCRLDANATPTQLWKAHQQRCALIETRLGEPALKGDLLPLFCAHHEALSAHVSFRLKTASTRALWKSYYRRAAPPPPFFDGELAPLDKPTALSS